MPTPRRLVLTLCCLLASALPVPAARAAAVQVVPLPSTSDGIVAAPDGALHVLEPLIDTDQVVARDGTVGVARTFPGPPVAAAPGADGELWFTYGGSHPGLVRYGTATNYSLYTLPIGAAFGCAPAGVVYDASSGGTWFTAPDTPDGCGTHGLGVLPGASSHPLAVATTGPASDIAAWRGALYVPLPDQDVVQRYTISGATLTPAGVITFPTGSGPAGIAVGSDEQLYVTLQRSGQVARFSPYDLDGASASIVASGLHDPFGIAAAPRGDVFVASHGDGTIWRVPTLASPWPRPLAIALPAGAHPRQLAYSGGDVWATDDHTAQVLRVVDEQPTLTLAGIADGAVVAVVDSRGNDTDVGSVIWDGGRPLYAGHVATVPAGTSPTLVTIPLSRIDAPPGDYTLWVGVSNLRGIPVSQGIRIHLDAPADATAQTPAPPRSGTPASKPLRLGDLVALPSSSRCVAARRVRLTLRKARAGASTIVRLRVTVGRRPARTYTAARLRKPVVVSGLAARGTTRVKLVATLADRTILAQTLSLRACAPHAPGR